MEAPKFDNYASAAIVPVDADCISLPSIYKSSGNVVAEISIKCAKASA